MEVAVIPVQVVEGAVDEVVDVVPVRDQGMAAAGVVLRRALDGGAGGGVPPVHIEDVLGDAGNAGRVQVPVVEIIRVIAMTNGPMTTTRTVLVGVGIPLLHGASPSSRRRIVAFGTPGQAGSAAA